ncbi:MAG: type I restriction-modification system subunit M N-terminal domain-containing protein [Halobacteriota archaeon]
MAKGKNNNRSNEKIINSQASMDKAVKSICDILRRDKAKGARLYVPELTWMFFLRYLDIQEQKEEQKAKAVRNHFRTRSMLRIGGVIGEHLSTTESPMMKPKPKSCRAGNDVNSRNRRWAHIFLLSMMNYSPIWKRWAKNPVQQTGKK